MKRFVLTIAMVLMAHGGLTAQDLPVRHGIAVIIYKYNHTVNVWSKTSTNSEYAAGLEGGIYRVFPTGPKLQHGDGRIPEGIYQADLRTVDGSLIIDIPYETAPGRFEHYRVTGPSLAKNAIPLKNDIYSELCDLAGTMFTAGFTSIPVVILPGDIEPEVAELLKRARNVEDGYTLDDVKESCRRWRPVENYIIRTGRIPGINAPALTFDDEDIILPSELPAEFSSETVAQKVTP